jgi:two-component system, sensor histidine kinase RpfC
MTLLGFLRRRLSTRTDTEHVMSLNRVAFCSLFAIYIASSDPANRNESLLVIAIGMAVTIAIFAHIIAYPAPNFWRRIVALFADMFVICYEMHLGGSVTSVFYPLILWTILGNGLRFGIPSLIRATLIGVTGFTLVVVTTPFWREHNSLSAGLIAGLILLPIYAGVLLKSLSAAKAQAEAASHAKSVFLASVSHELRTPLHAIIGSTSLLEGTKLTREQTDMTRTVMQASKSLLALIDDLLSYSKIEAGGLQIERAEFKLLPVLANVREILATAADAKGLRLAFHIQNDTPLLLVGDGRHVQEVLLNLVANAIKFTAFGGVLITVGTTKSTSTSARLRFEVMDTGIGVAPEAHGRIFESFTQADERIGQRFGGTGLGLAISKRLVESMQGQIGVQSQLGSGSTFWFELPFDRADYAQNGAASWPTSLVTMGLGGPMAQTVVEQAAKIGASLREITFDNGELREVLADGLPAKPQIVLAAPATQDQVNALVAAARERSGRHALPLIGVGSAAFFGPEIRWFVSTFLPSGFKAAELAQALQIVHGLGSAEATETTPVASEPVRQEARRQCRILVADDNRLNQLVVGRILESGAHSYDVVADGQAALDALEGAEYDLVLMDVNMPGIDGIEATKLYRMMSLGQRHVPIVGLTADAMPETNERCREAGMDECAVKPVAAGELLDLIERMAAPTAAAVDRGRAAPGRLRPVEEVVLDEEQVDSLRALGGQGFLLELLDGFVREAEELIDSLSAAQRRGELRAFRANAHALASSAANLGAVRIKTLGTALERFGPTELKGSGGAKVIELGRELERLRQETIRQRAYPRSA